MAVTEEELEELVDRQWLDRRGSADNILESIGKIAINTNKKIDETNLKLNELVTLSGGDPATIPDKNILPGDLGISLAVADTTDILSCVINGITTNAIARSYISKYESIIVVPGGTFDEPFVVSTAIVVKGTEEDVPITFNISDINSDIDGLKAQACNSLIYGKVSDGVTQPFSVDAWGNIIASSNQRAILTIDGNTYFTDGLVTDASENEDLTIINNKITIKTITIHSLQNLNYRLWFYTKDTFGVDDIIGYVDLNLPTSGVTKVIGATTYYVYSIVDVDQPFEDLDESLEIHLQLENKSGAAKNAGATGKVQLTLVYGINN